MRIVTIIFFLFSFPLSALAEKGGQVGLFVAVGPVGAVIEGESFGRFNLGVGKVFSGPGKLVIGLEVGGTVSLRKIDPSPYFLAATHLPVLGKVRMGLGGVYSYIPGGAHLFGGNVVAVVPIVKDWALLLAVGPRFMDGVEMFVGGGALLAWDF